MDKEQGTKLSSKTDARVGLKLENRPEDWHLAPIQGDTRALSDTLDPLCVNGGCVEMYSWRTGMHSVRMWTNV
jgi:hypothetical protein